jgi:hypothetical protein
MSASVGVIYDPATSLVVMVVVPDQNDPRGDKQLNDPAFNPPGLIQARIPKISYTAGDLPTISGLIPIAVAQQLLGLKSAVDLGLIQPNPGPAAGPLPPPNLIVPPNLLV